MKMSRRKQARPIRLIDDEEDQAQALDLQITTAPANGKLRGEKN